jgi:hypothetical protein
MAGETVKLGIATREELRARAIAITSGERRHRPDEPKIWFTSLESLARVLSGPNRELLRVIAERKPDCVSRLRGRSRTWPVEGHQRIAGKVVDPRPQSIYTARSPGPAFPTGCEGGRSQSYAADSK